MWYKQDEGERLPLILFSLVVPCTMPTCSDWCPLCYSNVRGRSNYRGHRGYRPFVSIYHSETTAMLRKPSGPVSGSTAPADTLSPGVMSCWPLLWEFLITPSYDDGSRRQLPTLMLFLHDGRLTGALNDRDNGRSVFVSGISPNDVLDALEMGLKDDSLVWRPNGKAPQRKK